MNLKQKLETVLSSFPTTGESGPNLDPDRQKTMEVISVLVKALDRGPTPGLWRDCGGMTPGYGALHSDEGYIVYGYADSTVHTEHGSPIKAPGMDRQFANRKWIAAAHPAQVSVLLEQALDLMVENQKLKNDNQVQASRLDQFVLLYGSDPGNFPEPPYRCACCVPTKE